MPIQTEMLPVLAVCREAELMQQAVDEGRRLLVIQAAHEDYENNWQHWGRGALTLQQLSEAHNPHWAWGDYSI